MSIPQFNRPVFILLLAFHSMVLLAGSRSLGQEPAKIAYLSGTTPADIVVINSDGTGAQNMGVSGFNPNRVALGPDSEWLAFAGFQNSQPGIFVMRVAAQGPGNVPLLVNSDYWGFTTIAWHPGGKHLAWVASDDQYYPQVYLGEVIDGTGAITPVGPTNPKVALTQRGQYSFYCEDPAFSPDGKWLATVRGVSSLALLKIRNEAGEITPESPTNPSTSVSSRVGEGLYPYWPSWSPNGRDLVFVQQRVSAGSDDQYALVTLSVLSAEGIPIAENAGNPRRVLIAPASHPTHYPVAFPSWSPDGTLIAFQSLKTAVGAGGVTYPDFEIATLLASEAESPSNLRQIVVPLASGGGQWPTFQVSAVNFGSIEDPTWEEDIETAQPPMSGRNWRFHARNNSRPNHPGMTARVEYSATPGEPGSWIDLGEMRTSGSLRFILDTSFVPVGSFAFRIKTSVPGGGPTYSEASPVYDILEAAPILETELDVSSHSDPSGDTTHRGDLLTYTLRFRNSGAAPYGALKARIVYPRNTTTNFPAQVTPELAKTTPGGQRISNGEDFAWEWSIPSVRQVGQTPFGQARNTTKTIYKRVKGKRKKFTVYDKTLFSMPNDPSHGFENGDVLRLHQYYTTPLPSGLAGARNYYVVNATAGQFQLAATAGGSPLLLTGIANRIAPLHFERTNEWQTRTVSFRLSDPTPAQELAQQNAGLPTINAEGGVITARARVLTATLSELDSVYGAPSTLVNPLSLTIERVFENGPAAPGDLVTFNLIAKNNSSLRVSQASVTVSAPRGLGLRGAMAFQGTGDHPVFLDDGGQPAGPPIDSATNRQVVRPASWKSNPELVETEISGPSPDSVPSFEQQARFYFGAIDPGVIRKMRFTCRVQYDWDTESDPEIVVEPEDVVFAGKNGLAERHRTLENEMTLDVVEAAPGSSKPEIVVLITQEGTGSLPEDRMVATVDSVAGLSNVPQVAGSSPQRGVNEIVYRATYGNYGDTSANFVRLWMPIPEGTEYVKTTLFRPETRFRLKKRPGKKPLRVKYTVQVPYTVESARIIRAFEDTGEIPVPKVVGGGTWFTCLVPSLAPHREDGWLKTLEFRVKLKPGVAVGTRILQPGGFATSRELFHVQAPVFIQGVQRDLVAQVGTPANMNYLFDAKEEITLDAQGNPNGYASLAHRLNYHNRGSFPATGFGTRYTIPYGFKFRDARYVDENGAVVRTTGITKPDVGTGGGGEVVFNTGTVSGNATGIAEVVLDYDRDSFPDEDTTPNANSRGGVTTAAFRPYHDAKPLVEASPSEALAESEPENSEVFDFDFFGTFDLNNRAVFSERARLFVGVIAPAHVEAGSEVTYRILAGNHSDFNAQGEFLHVRIPHGTTYVRRTVAMEQGGAYVVTGFPEPVAPPNSGGLQQLGLPNPNGNIAYALYLPANSCVAIDFTVQLGINAPAELVMLGAAVGGVITNSVVTESPIACKEVITSVSPAGTLNRQMVFESQIGAPAAAALGKADSQEPRFIETRNAITQNSVVMAFGGADVVTVPGGSNLALIPLGGGQLVAAGGGNLVGNDGNSIITGTGGALVAAGGGNLVAAGGGNLITFEVPGVGRLTAQQYFAQLPQLVAAGGGNILEAGGLNLVRQLVGQDGSTLGLDGAKLIGLDGGTLATYSQEPDGTRGFILPDNSLVAFAASSGRLVAAGGGNLVAAGGGNLVAAGGGNLVAAGGGNLVAAGGGNILSTSKINFIDVAKVVPTGAGGLFPTKVPNLVAAGGGNLVAAGGGNVIHVGAGLIGKIRIE